MNVSQRVPGSAQLAGPPVRSPDNPEGNGKKMRLMGEV